MITLNQCTEVFAILREHGYEAHFSNGNIEIDKEVQNGNTIIN